MPQDAMAAELALNAAKALTILLAINLTLFALWCEYMSQHIDRLVEEDPKFDRGLETYKVRVAGFVTLSFHLLFFFGASGTRSNYPAYCYSIFAVTLIAHFWIQNGVESKISGAKTSFVSQASQSLRQIFWSTMAAMSYLACFLTCMGAAATLARLTGWPTEAKLTIVLIGAVFGVLAGLAASFTLAPFWIRKTFAAIPVENPALVEKIREAFTSAGLKTPAIYSIHMDHYHTANAMVAGLLNRKGVLGFTLFVSQTAIEKLTTEQLLAVVAHEISHLRLGHLKKRMIYSSGLIVCSALITGFFIVLAQAFFPSGVSKEIVAAITLTASIIMSFRLISEQSRFQEIEADVYTVDRLGVPLERLIETFREMDRINQAQGAPTDTGAVLMGKSHPQTEHRIRALRFYFENRDKAGTGAAPAEPSDSDSSKAA